MMEKRDNIQFMAATYNTTEPHGPRPYHLQGCSYVTASTSVGANWVTYRSIEAAVQAGHSRVCKRCSEKSRDALATVARM